MSKKPTLFITGNSSGLGRGLTEAYLERGWEVYGCSRRGCDIEHEALHDVRCDLADFEAVPASLEKLLGSVDQLDLVILNAGMIGEIKEMHDTSLAEIREVMDINVWSNKVILDWLHQWGRPVEQIMLVSSGASVLGNKGWGSYALSKSAVNMLARLYSHEFPETHISAVAPGLIDSAMMDYLCEEPDPDRFPAMERIRGARGTDVMPKPREAAERVAEAMPAFREFDSGSFIDIRQIQDPEQYEALMKG